MPRLRSLRVVHVASYGGAQPGGFVPAIRALARRIIAHGHEFELIVPPVAGAAWHADVSADGATVTVIGSKARVFAHLVRRRPQLIHAHFYAYGFPAGLAALACRAKFVWHVHTGTAAPASLPARAIDAVRWMLARSGTLIVVGPGLADELRRRGAPPAVVITNGIDLDNFRPPTAAERAGARAALGASGRTILFFGRDPHVKGADVLVEALRDTPGTTLLTVASPPAQVDIFNATLPTVAIERLDDARLLHWAADLVALPSRFEAASFVMMEAVATGTPIVASDLPGPRSASGGSALARFVPVEDAAALRAAIGAPAERHLPEPAALAQLGVDQWVDRVLETYAQRAGVTLA